MLLRWGAIDGLDRMRSGQPAAFYDCILAGHLVPEGRKAAWYSRYLQDGAAPLAIEDAAPVAIEDGLVQGEAEQSEQDAEDSDAVQSGADGHGSRDEEPASSSPASSSSPSSSAVASSDDDDDEAVQEEVDSPWPRQIDGAKCTVDEFHDYQNYHRLRLKCRRHANCVKYRNTGERQCCNFGYREPVGFLGAWRQQGNRFASKRLHKNFSPSLDQVEAWLLANPVAQ